MRPSQERPCRTHGLCMDRSIMCLLVTSFDGPCKVSTKSNDKVPKVAVDLEQVSTAVWTGFRRMVKHASPKTQTNCTSHSAILELTISTCHVNSVERETKNMKIFQPRQASCCECKQSHEVDLWPQQQHRCCLSVVFVLINTAHNVRSANMTDVDLRNG